MHINNGSILFIRGGNIFCNGTEFAETRHRLYRSIFGEKDNSVHMQIEVPCIIKPSTVLSESIPSVSKSALIGRPNYQLD